jgi:transcriptional regulator with XRE-family HTH domain
VTVRRASHVRQSRCGSRSTAAASARTKNATLVRPRQTALGRLLQERREDAGYSRTRVGEIVGIKPGTIEGWELGRVARPPIHDVLRLAHFLRIPGSEIERAVFDDAGEAPAVDSPDERPRPRRRPVRGAVPLLEAAFRLFGWANEEEAAEALGASSAQVRLWRTGSEQMAFADYLTLTSMIGIAAAEAMKGDETKVADLAAAAEELGISPRVPSRR